MLITMRTSALCALLLAAPVSMVALAAPSHASGLDCDGSQSYSDLVLAHEGGAKAFHATNPTSTATGAYQFTFGTLKDLGFVESGSTPPPGEGDWSGVKWTGKGGIYSRSDFMNSESAQNLALDEFTKGNLQSVSNHWTEGQTVNGVPLTAGGVAFATHMLGAGGFQQWAASGFSPSGLNAGHAAAHNMSLDEYQNHFAKRLAQGGCMDPGMISSGSSEVGPMAEVGLMPWDEHRNPASVVLPGTLTSLNLD